MTRICPEPIPKTCQGLFAHMDEPAARFSSLATAGGLLALLDLTRLRPLLAEDESFRFLTTLLSPAEARLLASLTYPKRRLEWLGGRLVAKHCLNRLALALESPPACYCEYSILPDTHGRPTLAPPPGSNRVPTISISHSRDYAAALVTAHGTCGIDIQQKSAQLARVQERFATTEELTLLLHLVSNPLTRLGLIWTAKGAVKKCLLSDRPDFLGTISLTAISYEPKETIWTARCQVQDRIGTFASVRIAEFGDYLIACTAGDGYA